MRSVPAAVGLAALLALSGCGSSGTAHTGTATTSSSATATRAAPAATDTAASASPRPAGVASASAAVPLTGHIVFRRYGDADGTTGSLFVINADGTGERPLTTPKPAVLDCESNWSPDGKRVVFTRSTGDAEGVKEAHQLVTIGAGGGQETALTPRRPAPGDVVPGWDEGADFSPDGRQIAYVHGSSLREVTKSTLAVSCTDWTSSDV
ncbi:MAG: TolB protein, partial [Frankiales bacterium]|nr:TolB protein [Frankiales bacterium]